MFRAFRIGFTITGLNYSDELQDISSHEYKMTTAEIFALVSMSVDIKRQRFLNYGRPLSVSGRPCYILPMFFLFIYLFFFMAALFSGPG